MYPTTCFPLTSADGARRGRTPAKWQKFPNLKNAAPFSALSRIADAVALVLRF